MREQRNGLSAESTMMS